MQQRMVWARHIFVWLMIVMPLPTNMQDCLSGQLSLQNDLTPSMMLEEAVMLQLRPRTIVEKLSIQLLLETAQEGLLYCLGMDVNMNAQWSTVVTMKDASTNTTIFKVPWPVTPIPLTWTTLHLRLHYQHLLQFAVIPHKNTNIPRKFVSYHKNLNPLAASVHLLRTGVTRLRLKLLTVNTSIEYTINCEQESTETYFASEFGISSSVTGLHATVWILLGIILILLVMMAVILTLCYKLKKELGPSSFTQAGSNSRDAAAPVLVSSRRGGRQPAPESTANSLHPHQVTVGVLSSRAPSPGHEIGEENTFDYINHAFTHE
ncbi:uncharacterized protein LOC121860221 isoform X2 [Homarus americanus]|uniref:uncharacterized protein LOC121860221 isoform X2 n=1 Tax=Homarus americanus TaxID=6706 RepID=UPI001C4523A0|nr:uncharacterized protein LOC121860221 isoform X2 [Homarus americanus]